MASLHRAVALEEVDLVAVMVAEELHLDVARAAHELFQEDLVLAEGGLGLAAPRGHLLGEVQLALAMSGKPIPSAMSRASVSSSGSGPLAGMTASPARTASSRAATLEPSTRITSGRGPMKVIPEAATASANSGLSDRKPYPGWMASTLASRATRMMSAMSR
jgi:hypothetical protein